MSVLFSVKHKHNKLINETFKNVTKDVYLVVTNRLEKKGNKKENLSKDFYKMRFASNIQWYPEISKK